MAPVLQGLIAASAGFAFVFLIFVAVLLLCRTRPHKSPSTFLSAEEERSIAFDHSLAHISLAELAAATENFSPDRIVGDGSFGFVYKAILPSGATVAVKRLNPDAAATFYGFREFRAEMETLGRVRHPNLARLLGFCISAADRLLIYEFIHGGSLDQRLHEPADGGPLRWPARLRILRGVAAGLAFLHEECRPSIIHRDIKASNVLIDGDPSLPAARIADFGLARVMEASRSHVSTQEAAGTMGYMAPEYKAGMTAATAKADVYSFGALTVEVATGRRPSWPVRAAGGGEVGMLKWARREVEEGRGMEILDRLMGNEGLIEEEVRVVLEVAYRCTEENSRKRPSMGEV